MFCPHCGKDAGDSTVCPECNKSIYLAALTEPQAPSEPAPKQKKNLKPIIISAVAAVAVIIIVVAVVALAGGKKYFKKSDYKDSEKRVAQILEDTLDVLEEDEGEHTEAILTQSLELLDNGFDKEDLDTMIKILAKSDAWETVEGIVAGFEYTEFSFKNDVMITDEEDADYIKTELEAIDEEKLAGYIADNELFEMDEEQAEEFAKALCYYNQKLLDADIEKMGYYAIGINGDEYGFEVPVAKVDGKWIVPFPCLLLYTEIMDECADDVLLEVVEDFRDGVKVAVADPDNGIPSDISGTIELYVFTGMLNIEFDGEIADYSEEIISATGIEEYMKMAGGGTRFRITITEGQGFEIEEVNYW